MKHDIAFTVIYVGLSTALTPSSFPSIPGPLAASATYDTAAAPPSPGPGESSGQWIDQIFDHADSTYNSPINNTLGFLGSAISNESSIATDSTVSEPGQKKRKRDYVEAYGLHESIWANDTSKIGYNISVDLSNCSTGLRLSTNIGVYTFTNGTITNDTTLKAMVTDLWSLRHSVNTPNTRYANHTALVAQQALDEANQVLGMGLICQNATSSANTSGVITTVDAPSEIIHAELRKLLANTWSYWVSVLLSSGVGAAGGATVAALMDLAFNGNVTTENVVQTGVVVAIAILVSGILSRMHEVGRLDNAARLPGAAQAVAVNMVNAANAIPGVPGAREAVVQNVWLGNARRAIQRIASRQRDLEQALSEVGVSVEGSAQAVEDALDVLEAGTAAVSGVGTSTEVRSCLSETEAVEAAEAVGHMSLADLNLETMEEIQEQLAGRSDDGSCGV
ncbi:hypothetical protein JMJ35_001898 [Cladonia borealis]|uniref:Uncharacterized protein n=1 Tax=Cladonia borealis TaxID=184061 RepID=A0AA39V793_9LECA|nr:hypothetical protein JMJ35_001898 [Cladonia borealis]